MFCEYSNSCFICWFKTFSSFCSYILRSSSMVKASKLQFNEKALVENMKEVRQQVLIDTEDPQVFDCWVINDHLRNSQWSSGQSILSAVSFKWNFLPKIIIIQLSLLSSCLLRLTTLLSFCCRWTSSFGSSWRRWCASRTDSPAWAKPAKAESDATVRLAEGPATLLPQLAVFLSSLSVYRKCFI